MTVLHRRLAALLALIALLAFVSGAGLDAPSVVPAGIVLVLAVFLQPGAATSRRLEPVWRVAAVLLSVRAGARVLFGGGDPVLPMVDLLLLLLVAESLRVRDGSGDARHFALTFALLIASAAYRPGPLFGALFVVYVVCATVVLVLAHLDRQARAHGLRAPAATPRFLARVALLSSVVLIVSVGVFVFFPRVSHGWAAGRSPIVASAMVGFSDRVSIGEHGARIEPNPQVVLRVEFPGGAPRNVQGLHWRGRAYNRFDGVAWSRQERGATWPRESARWPGPLLEQVVYARPLGDANVIFGLHPIHGVTPESRIRPLRIASGDYLYVGDVDPVYRVQSRSTLPPDDSLRRAGSAYAPAILAHLQLPPTSRRVLALADSFRRAAPTPYDQALAVERWLRNDFDYTLDLPRTAREATLDHFLFERRAGHCEYFSTAMAVLLRAGGVPTRNVNGFLGGAWNDFGQFLTVTQNNAHSWVEVYFPDWGWVPFDPTPSGSVAELASSARRSDRFGLFFDNLDHRWGKWILDYDLGLQRSLLDRATPGGGGTSGTRARDPDDSGSFWPLLTLGVVAVAAFLMLRRVRTGRAGAAGPATRDYLRLRRAYERAGFAPASALPPLAFLGALGTRPGGADARRAVELYIEARFGARPLDTERRTALRESVAAAIRGLRRG